MFCTNCGTQLSDTANFCGSCGSAVKHAAAPEAQIPPPVQPQPAPPAPFTRPTPQSICVWCAAPLDVAQLSCPRCGATVDAPPISASSGWEKLPGRKDMAKLQFGDSFCQIEGKYVPVADVNLVG